MNKLSIIGAGSVGSNLAYLSLLKKIFREIVLVDIDSDFTQGIACDLEDCRFIFQTDTKVTGTNDYTHTKDSDIVVITAGLARTPGMSREDLLKNNKKIVTDVSKKIKQTSPQAIVIVVTNPLDLMTYIAISETGFPKNRVIGMGTNLDASRLANQLSKETDCSIKNIEPIVVGIHGKEMLVSEYTSISNFKLDKRIPSSKLNTIKEKTYNRGKEIVDFLKKGSARFAPAAAILQLIEAIAGDSNQIFTVSCLLEGEYELSDVCLGIPVILGQTGIKRILNIEFSLKEKEHLKLAEKAFKDSLNSCS